MIMPLGLLLGAGACAISAIHTTRLLSAVLSLAGLSVLLSLLFFWMDAPVIAVVELSVGAGLVTVLLALSISLTGDTHIGHTPGLPRWLALLLSAMLTLALGGGMLGIPPVTEPANDVTVSRVFWEQRSADVLLQSALIFVALLTVTAVLTGAKTSYPTQTEPTLLRSDSEVV